MIYELKLEAQQVSIVAQLLVQSRDAAAAQHNAFDAVLSTVNDQCKAQTEAAQAAEAAAPVGVAPAED